MTIFVFIYHGCLTSMVSVLAPNNSVIKRLWCICTCIYMFKGKTCKLFHLWRMHTLAGSQLYQNFCCLLWQKKDLLQKIKRAQFIGSQTGTHRCCFFKKKKKKQKTNGEKMYIICPFSLRQRQSEIFKFL